MRGSTLIAVSIHDLFFTFLVANVKWFRFPFRVVYLTAKGKLSENRFRRYLSLPHHCKLLLAFCQRFFNKKLLFRRNIFSKRLCFRCRWDQSNTPALLRLKAPRLPSTLPPLKDFGKGRGNPRRTPCRF